MASFFEELWGSVFTPGTTPALVRATNISFFLLQTILIVMFFATYSIHFVIMNVLSGGLWAAINWFVKELEEYRQSEQEKNVQLGMDNDMGGPEGLEAEAKSSEARGNEEKKKM